MTVGIMLILGIVMNTSFCWSVVRILFSLPLHFMFILLQYFKRQIGKIAHKIAWIWLKAGNLVSETEYLFIIFANLSARAGYDTRAIFKRSLTGLNSEFSFS